MRTLDSRALALAAGVLSTLAMLALGILANFGIYTGAAEAMSKWHLFFDLSVWGVILGMIEAFVHGFVWGYLLGWFYNRFTRRVQ